MSEEEEGSQLEFMADQLYLDEDSQEKMVSDKYAEGSDEGMETTGVINRKCKKKFQEVLDDDVKKETIKDEFIEQSQASWKPVIYHTSQESNKTKKIKFQYHQNSLYPTKVIQRRKKFKDLDMNDPVQAKSRLQKLAKQYHKNLLDEVMQQQRIKKESGVKDQEEMINLDVTLNRFPIYSPAMREKNYKSVEELKEFLRNQEQEILAQINDPAIRSIFVQSFQQITKNSQTSKEYHNFKCKIQGCQAILKCVSTLQHCQLYTFRNRHNHTITGEIKISNDQPREAETITIDEDLHQMFGFNKGVRSQTRNIKYLNPQMCKIVRKERALLRKQERTKEGGCQEKATRVMKKRTSKTKKKNVKKIEEMQFSNMVEELQNEGYKALAFHKEEQQSPFPQFILLTKLAMISSYANSTVVRLKVMEQSIKLDKKKYANINNWSVATLTVFNQYLKSVVVAIALCIFPFTSHLSRIVPLIHKILPQVKYLVTEHRKEFIGVLPNICSEYDIKLLVDSEDLTNILKKDLKDPKHQRIIKDILTPSSVSQQILLNALKSLNQTAVVHRYQQLQDYIIQYDSTRPYLQFYHHLQHQKEITHKCKVKLRGGLSRQTLKTQFHNLMEVIFTHNKEINKQVQEKIISQIQLERSYQDTGIKMVRQSVSPQLFNLFYQQYYPATLLTFIQIDQGYLFDDKNQVSNWICSCCFTKMTGVPCKHLIRILKREKKNYLGLFHHKWIVNDLYLAEQEVSEKENRFYWAFLNQVEQRPQAINQDLNEDQKNKEKSKKKQQKNDKCKRSKEKKQNHDEDEQKPKKAKKIQKKPHLPTQDESTNQTIQQ